MSMKPTKVTDKSKAWNRKKKHRNAPCSKLAHMRFLIISEDKKSSTWYFEELVKQYDERLIYLRVVGCGKNTQSLVNDVEGIRKDAEKKLKEEFALPLTFDQIWLVFDKDDFPDDKFDNAISSAKKIDKCHVAWSNECFEYWYLLHFVYATSAMDRDAIFKKLRENFPGYEEKFGKVSYRELKGEKGLQFHQEMAHHPNLKQALKWSDAQNAVFNAESPHESNPSTHISDLIHALDAAKNFASN